MYNFKSLKERRRPIASCAAKRSTLLRVRSFVVFHSIQCSVPTGWRSGKTVARQADLPEARNMSFGFSVTERGPPQAGLRAICRLLFGRPADPQPGAVRSQHSRRIRLAGTTQLTPLTIFFSFDGGIARFTALVQESNRGIETGTISFCPAAWGRRVWYQSTGARVLGRSSTGSVFRVKRGVLHQAMYCEADSASFSTHPFRRFGMRIRPS